MTKMLIIIKHKMLASSFHFILLELKRKTIEVFCVGCDTTKNKNYIWPGFSYTTFFILEKLILIYSLDIYNKNKNKIKF